MAQAVDVKPYAVQRYIPVGQQLFHQPVKDGADLLHISGYNIQGQAAFVFFSGKNNLSSF